jgi:hypothetical protein
MIFFTTWADGLEPAAEWLARLPAMDLRPRVSDPRDHDLLQRARLDADWHGECARCWAALPGAPAWVSGPAGLADWALGLRTRPSAERWWLVFIGQDPQKLGPALDPLLRLARAAGGRVAYYAFDEASRTMPCFPTLAPHLDVLLHDEAPLVPGTLARLRPACVTRHRSWVANLIPMSVPFNPTPEPRIVFLGSQLGLTPHRRRQLEFLTARYGDHFTAHCDHALAMSARGTLTRYAVSVCPEGRKFTTPAMSGTHTDRPFWSGAMGLVPVCEDSQTGGRLESLAQARLILRYPHGDLTALGARCDEALALAADPTARQRLYAHFNAQETVGSVLAEALAVAEAHVARCLPPVTA